MRSVTGVKPGGIETIVSVIARAFIVVAVSAFAACYLELFMRMASDFTDSRVLSVVRAGVMFCVFCLLQYVFLERFRHVGSVLFKYRFVIGGVLFALLVVFQISGSSVGMWQNYLDSPGDSGVIWGVARGIRSDEWTVNLPFFLSQDQSGYMAMNDLIRGTSTSVSLVPSLPAYSIACVFKPFFWGFLLFGAEYGLAWLWSGRAIALFLITIEFFLIVTGRNKWLSLSAAVIVTFSAYTQWWGCFEPLLYGQLIVVLLNTFLRTRHIWIRFLSTVGIAWTAGCYLFIAYPAWIVPCFFLFLLVGIWVIVNYVRDKDYRILQRADGHSPNALSYVFLGVCMAVSVVLWIAVFLEARDAIAGMSNTIYPGSRTFLGGGGFWTLFDYAPSLFGAIDPLGLLFPNICERAALFTLFPVGICVAVFVICKKRDLLLIMLLVLELVYLAFVICGFPEWLAKATLLSLTFTNRLMLAVGFLDVMLLMVGLDRILRLPKAAAAPSSPALGASSALSLKKVIIFVSACLVCAGVLFFLGTHSDPDFWRVRYYVLYGDALLAFSVAIGLFFTRFSEFSSRYLCAVFIGVVFISGICVNPLQRGTDVVSESDIYREVERIADEDPDALWYAEGPWFYSNLCAAAGASTLTSTNVYPNMEMWEKLDPNGSYEEVYLRYSNITSDVSDEDDADYSELLELLNTDSIKIDATADELRKLDVKYLLADEEHEDDDGVDFQEIYRTPGGQFIVYKLDYA